MEFRSVSKNCIKEWYIVRTLWFLVVAGVLVGGCFLPATGRGEVAIKTVLLIFWGMLTALVFVNAYIFPVLQYNRLQYRIDASRIEKHSGIIFLRQEFVPFARIQHTEIYRGILDRIFRMATVVVYTAGSAMRIQNLDTVQADELILKIQELMEKTKGETVNDE